VILASAPTSFEDAHRLVSSDLAGQLIAYDGGDGRHVVLRDLLGAHRVWLRDLQAGAGMAAIIPLDEACCSVLRACCAFSVGSLANHQDPYREDGT